MPVAPKWPSHLSAFVQPGLGELENLLHGKGVAFHAGDFLEAGQTARTVRQPHQLDDDVHCAGHLLL
jgi:hypothetical protein